MLFLVLGLSARAQQPARSVLESSKPKQKYSLQKPPLTAYKIISRAGDTAYVDTSLNIQKEYKYNYLRKDNFELVSFSKLGQTYNSLAHSIKGKDLIPEFGARTRHFNFMEEEDISYYEVPTPLTETAYKIISIKGDTTFVDTTLSI